MCQRASTPQRRVATLLVLALGLLLGAGTTPVIPAAKQRAVSPNATVMSQVASLLAEKEVRTPAERRIESGLLAALRQSRRARPDNMSGPVEVEISAVVTKELIASLEALGAQVSFVSGALHSIHATIPLAQVETVAAANGVVFVRPASRPLIAGAFDSASAARVRDQLGQALPQAQRNRSEGDTAHGADKARATYGVTGKGVKVGVIADGVDGLEALQATGDLTKTVTVLPGQAGSGNAGAAMLEIIYDLAPDAQLFFATALPNIPAFAQNIRALRAAGCDIIVDAARYPEESPFQMGQGPDVVSITNGGAVTQAVNEVVKDGALYIAAAGDEGNEAQNKSSVWEGYFMDGGPVPDTAPKDFGNGRLHAFGKDSPIGKPTTFTTTLVLSTSTRLISLFWNDPLGRSSNDYDLLIIHAGKTISSTITQAGQQDPYEAVAASAEPFVQGDTITIIKRGNAEDHFLHLDAHGGTFGGVLNQTNRADDPRLVKGTNGQISGHTGASAVLTTAAISVTKRALGQPFPYVEPYSSDGPRRVFFNENGVPFTPDNPQQGAPINKPDLTAGDAVTCATPGYSTYNGTGAAAAHTAAIAALAKSFNPFFTTRMITEALLASARTLPVGSPQTGGAGFVLASRYPREPGMPLGALEELGADTHPSLALTSTIQTKTLIGDGDEFVEPNETTALTVTLANLGLQQAENISMTLTTKSQGVAIISGTAALLSMTARTMPVQFVFGMGRDAPCGLPIQFELKVDYRGGFDPSGVDRRDFTFEVPTGQKGLASTNTFTYSGSAVPIPDGVGDIANPQQGQPITATLNVPALTGRIAHLTFRFDGEQCTNAAGATTVGVDHTWIHDLVITLRHGNKSATLLNQADGSGNNLCQVTLDDNEDTSIQAIQTKDAPFTGRYRPASPLAAFIGEDPAGTWILEAVDYSQQDTGNLRAFSLIITTYNACDAPVQPAIISADAGATTQQAGLNASFARPLEVLVTDAGGMPMPNVPVSFSVIPAGTGAGAALLDAASTTTNATGRARVRARANDKEGSYTVKATVSGPRRLEWVFSLTNTANQPALAFEASSLVLGEGSNNVALTVELEFPIAAPVIATYTVGGTAAYGSDHNLTPGTITILPGSISAIINFNTFANPWVDGDRTLVVALAPPTNAVLKDKNAITIVITDHLPVRRTIYLPISSK